MTADVVELYTKMDFPPVNGSNGEQLAYQAWELQLLKAASKDNKEKLVEIDEGLLVCRKMLEFLAAKRPGEYIKFTNTYKMLAFEHAEEEAFIEKFS